MVDEMNGSELVDNYIKSFEPEIRSRLNKIRAIIKKTAPDAEETIAYKMPTYRLNGNLVHFAAFKNHIGFYPTPSGISNFREELANYKVAKGSIQFPHQHPIPYNLIKEIVKLRVAENSKDVIVTNKKRSLSDEAVKKATGKDWDNWLSILKEEKADKLEHAEIARLLNEKHKIDGWWAQSITVEFERHIGKRKVGEVKDGTFQTAVSKTLPGNIDQVYKAWLNHITDIKSFNSLSISEEARLSESDKWRYWRTALEDGTRIVVTVGYKTDEKSSLTIGMEKLQDQSAVKFWKDYWKKYLENFKV